MPSPSPDLTPPMAASPLLVTTFASRRLERVARVAAGEAAPPPRVSQRFRAGFDTVTLTFTVSHVLGGSVLGL